MTTVDRIFTESLKRATKPVDTQDLDEDCDDLQLHVEFVNTFVAKFTVDADFSKFLRSKKSVTLSSGKNIRICCCNETDLDSELHWASGTTHEIKFNDEERYREVLEVIVKVKEEWEKTRQASSQSVTF